VALEWSQLSLKLILRSLFSPVSQLGNVSVRKTQASVVFCLQTGSVNAVEMRDISVKSRIIFDQSINVEIRAPVSFMEAFKHASMSPQSCLNSCSNTMAQMHLTFFGTCFLINEAFYFLKMMSQFPHFMLNSKE